MKEKQVATERKPLQATCESAASETLSGAHIVMIDNQDIYSLLGLYFHSSFVTSADVPVATPVSTPTTIMEPNGVYHIGHPPSLFWQGSKAISLVLYSGPEMIITTRYPHCDRIRSGDVQSVLCGDKR